MHASYRQAKNAFFSFWGVMRLSIEQLDPRALQKLSTPSWAMLLPSFEVIHLALISVSATSIAELTTIYIKYVDPSKSQKPYAVVWIKRPSEIVLGLSLPPESISERLTLAPSGFVYSGLTGYVRIASALDLPVDLDALAKQAHSHLSASVGE